MCDRITRVRAATSCNDYFVANGNRLLRRRVPEAPDRIRQCAYFSLHVCLVVSVIAQSVTRFLLNGETLHLEDPSLISRAVNSINHAARSSRCAYRDSETVSSPETATHYDTIDLFAP
jgi:hypothetical protein